MSNIRIGMIATAVVLMASLSSADPLFPRPLHIVRVVTDPLAGAPLTIDEYYEGDRVVAVAGDLVAIADYARETLTRIDRGKATYSVTRFADLAAARHELIPERRDAVGSAELPPAAMRGSDLHLHRPVELYVAELPEMPGSVEIAVDRSFSLSSRAVEVITGSAWPDAPTLQGRIAMRVAAPGSRVVGIRSESSAAHALPVRITVTLRFGSESITLDNRIAGVDERRVPAELLGISAGAVEVLHPDLEAVRALRSLETPAAGAEPR